VGVMAKVKITASDAAKFFVGKADPDAGDHITHLKLQKLIYFAQAYYLANFGKPLFDEDFQAWPHGPVVQSVWHEYKGHSYNPIPPVGAFEIDDNHARWYLDAVWDKFGVFSAKKLEQMTHEHLPWQEARGELPPEAKCKTVISKDSMKKFYGKRIKTKE
jgi:uncharacterized phage-associated protein